MSFHIVRPLILAVILLVVGFRLDAQPCADTQPSIAGPQVVSNNQLGVVYSTPNIPGHTYAWTVTGGTVTGGAGTSQITVAWGSVGNGSVSVLETNPAVNCSTSVSRSVTIQPLLISYFYYTNTSCYGDVVSFWDASVCDAANPIVGYYWTFGDGGTSTLKDPQHMFLPPYNITYTIMLVITNQGGQKDTIYDAVYVNPNQFIPSPRFTSDIPNCTYSPVQFNSTASTTPAGTGSIIHWDWNFDDPASGNNTSTLQNPTHVFSAPGTYDIKLEITNERYCINDTTITITILESVPDAQFAYSSPTCLNNPVDFTNGSTFPTGHDIIRWIWNFGDGSVPVIVDAPANPDITHYFPGLGPYAVKLTVINDLGCRDSLTQTFQLDPAPTSDFSYVMKCQGDSVPFTDISILNNGPVIVSWNWNFGDPNSPWNTSTQQHPKHVFSDIGTYDVRLVTVNSSGCPDTIIKPVTVYPKPPVEYTWNIGNQNNEIQFHLDTNITPIGMIGPMITWNFGDGGFATGTYNPTYIYPVAGSFIVTVTVTDTIGCSNFIEHVISVPSIPVALFSSNSPQCDGQPICFTDLSSVPTPPFGWIQTWIWNYGDGSPNDTIHFPNLPNTCHLYTTVDTFAVTLTVYDNNGFTDDYTSNVYTLPNPVANYTYSTACQNQVVQFTDLSSPNSGGNLISWDWNFADPGSGVLNYSGFQNPIHSFSYGDSTYMVRLIVRNFNDCVDTIYKPVYVFPSPPVEFLHDSACLEELVHFWADTTILYLDSIATWSWNFGDGTPAATDPERASHLYTIAGIYPVTLTVTDHRGCMNTVTHTVKVNPKPVSNFTWSSPMCQNESVQFTDQSYIPIGFTGFIAKWYWEFDDGTDSLILFPNTPNITHVFQGIETSYTVRLTVWSNDSCTQYIEKTVNLIPSPIANFEYSTIACAGQTVQFNDISQPNGGGDVVQWTWNFGDPPSGPNNTATIKSPTHTYITAGTYTVRLIVMNGNNCKDTIVKQVIINQKPVANFSADTACLGNPTTFTDLSIPNASSIITYSWNFGDGAPLSSQPNPTHTYTTYGLKTVTLTVTNSNGCIKDTSKTILVNPLPIADFTFTSPNCLGSPIQYTDLSSTVTGYLGQIVKWEWNFDDGSPNVVVWYPGNPNVSHIFAGNATQHLVKLTVTTSDSCVHWVEKTVNSIPAPAASFAYSSTVCENQTTQFTDNSQPNGGGALVGWYWDFGDPSSGLYNYSSAQHPTHIFTHAGTFNVTLIVTSANNCKDTIVLPVSVALKPVANFQADTACLGTPTVFTDLSTPNALLITSYSWDFGDGLPPSTLSNPTHTYLSYGVKTVKLTIINSNGCVKDTSKQILVNPLPIAEFTYNTPNCLGAPVSYTNQSSTVPGYPAQIIKWTWNFDDGTTPVIITYPGNPSISHVFAGIATYHNVTLTVQTADSCIHSVTHLVNSIPQPIANFYFPPNNCALQPTQFTDNSQPNGGGTINGWLWNFGDPASGIYNNATAQNPIHSFSAAGTYTVTLIVSNATGCSDTISYPVTILARPVANFISDTVCQGTVTTFTDQSTPSGTISTYYWEFGEGGTATVANPTYLYGSPGTYPVKLTVTTAEGCIKDTTKTVHVWGKPTANFTFTSPTCASDSAHFMDLSSTPHGSIQQWVWDFGDGSTPVTINFPANQNISHLFPSGGTFSVKLTITTTDGCDAEKILPVTIEYAPIANFYTANNPCALSPLQFTDNSQTNGGQSITQWLWNFGDPASGLENTATVQNPLHAFSAGGTFTVTLTVTNATGCIDSVSIQVTVNSAPVVDFTADTSCMTSPTQFTDASAPGSGTIAIWLWNFGDPSSGIYNTSPLQNPTHTYDQQGTYQVTLTVTNSNQCVNDTSIWIEVFPKPNAMYSYSASCVGTETQFTDLSTAPGSQITTWYWDFDDGVGTSTSQNPTYTYTTAGTYNVLLVVTNLNGCTDSITQPVVARPTPTAAFTYQTFFCPPGQVNFQDQSVGNSAAIVERLWIFEPGYTSTLPNPTYIFEKTDTCYAVTLIAIDNFGCRDTVIDTICVKPGFTFTFTFDSVCLGYPTHFTSINQTPGDTLYSPRWDFGDPNSGQNNHAYVLNPVHTFLSPGLYNVKLRVYNSDNCADSVYREVMVYEPPAPLFDFETLPCDSTIYFTDMTVNGGSGSIAQWEWHFGDGSAPLVIPAPGPGNTSHLYVNPGFYEVMLVITSNSGCIDSIKQTVQRFPCIQAAYAYQDTLRCMNYPVVFADTSLPVALITSWDWDWNDGSYTSYTTYTETVTHTYTMPGTYLVKLKIHAMVQGTDIQDSIVKQVVIHPTPDPAYSNRAVCLNLPTIFLDTTNTYGEPVFSWSWNFGEPSSGINNTSTLQNPTHNYATRDTFDVKLLVMNRFGCMDSITKPTRIYGLPEAHIQSSAACVGDPTLFYDMTIPSDTTLMRWHWDFGDINIIKDTSNLQDPQYKYKDLGNYTVRLIVADNFGCMDTIDSTVTVNVTPLGVFTVTEGFDGKQGSIKLNNQSSGATGYLWDFGNGQTSTEENPIVSYTEDGTYIIQMIALNEFNCTDTTYFEYEILFKGLYVPNAFSPTSSNLAVRLFKPVGINLKQYHVQVFDQWGTLVWESTELDSEGRPEEGWDGEYEGSLMPQGTYMWKIKAVFIDDSSWNGSDIGQGEYKTIGTVSLIR